MGAGQSQKLNFDRKSHWQKLVHFEDAKATYVKDQSIGPDSSRSELELRALLDSHIAVEHMKVHCRSIGDVGSYNLLVSWKVLQKLGNNEKFTLEQLYTICCSLYGFTEGKAQEVFGILRARTSFLFRASMEQRVRELPLLFYKCRRTCFECIFLMYESFVRTPSFTSMCTALRTEFNNVTPDDFVYLSKLGAGTYGVVLHCMKRSTGMRYAMKVQHKAALLWHFRSDPSSVVVEMRANACCRHHYLTELCYAFQTPTLAIMVMKVCACGNLNQSLRRCPNRQMSLERVQFYTAEIISALQYLHANDLVYRDLKPANVLLNSDGHIMLADFGSLADLEGSLGLDKDGFEDDPKGGRARVPAVPVFDSMITLPQRIFSAVKRKPRSREPRGSSTAAATASSSSDSTECPTPAPTGVNYSDPNPPPPLYDPLPSSEPPAIEDSFAHSDYFGPYSAGNSMSLNIDASAAVETPNKKTVQTVVGTLEYMAPEILTILAAPTLQVSVGYAEAVDWWSLGGLVYKLLFGKLPFRVLSVEDVRFEFAQCLGAEGDVNKETFERIFGALDVEADIAKHPTLGASSSSSTSTSTGRHVASFIHGLICIDPAARLGYKGGAAKENVIRSHPFLKSVDWELLEKKQFPPPYLPVSEVIVPEGDDHRRPVTDDLDSSAHGQANRPPTFDGYNFDEMLHTCGKTEWVTAGEATLPHILMGTSIPGMGLLTKSGKDKGGRPPKEDTLDARRHRSPPRQGAQRLQIPEEMQEYFATWRYVSPSMIDNEEIQYAKSKGSAGGRLIRTVLGLGEDSLSL